MKLFFHFLCLVFIFPISVASTPTFKKDKISNLPTLKKMPKFPMYSGYLNAGNGSELFYWFNECENSSSDILIVWLNGGPGCSSLFGLFVENGPFTFDKDRKKLIKNRFSWNRLGHTLYIDTPIGVGFSKPHRDINTYSMSDEMTSELNFHMLGDFMLRFPKYKNSKIFFAGESYAGIYIPTLARKIFEEKSDLAANIKGLMLGNPLLNHVINRKSQIVYAYNHGFISRELYDSLMSNYCYSKNIELKMRGKCAKSVMKFRQLITNNAFNVYNYVKKSGCTTNRQENDFIYNYDFQETDEQLLLEHLNKSLPNINLTEELDLSNYSLSDVQITKMNPKLKSLLDRILKETMSDDCAIDQSFSGYLNSANVQEAIHAKRLEYHLCSMDVSEYYQRNIEDVTEHIKYLESKNIKTLLYYGDQDMMCPFVAGEEFVMNLSWQRSRVRSPWYVRNRSEIGGFLEKFGNITFATIKGAGHMAPQDRPFETFNLIRRFLRNY